MSEKFKICFACKDAGKSLEEYQHSTKKRKCPTCNEALLSMAAQDEELARRGEEGSGGEGDVNIDIGGGDEPEEIAEAPSLKAKDSNPVDVVTSSVADEVADEAPPASTLVEPLNSEAARKRRAERFGTTPKTLAAADSKKARMARFGLPTKKNVSLGSTDKKRKRQEKFGAHITTGASSLLDPEKKAARAARFGTVNKAAKASSSSDNKQETPILKGLTDTDAIAKRAARFGGATAKGKGLSEEQQQRVRRMGLPVAGLPKEGTIPL